MAILVCNISENNLYLELQRTSQYYEFHSSIHEKSSKIREKIFQDT